MRFLGEPEPNKEVHTCDTKRNLYHPWRGSAVAGVILMPNNAINRSADGITYPKGTVEGNRRTQQTKWRHLAGAPGRCSRPPSTVFVCHAAAHLLLPGAVCLICAILSADFVDWALASCTRANQRETGQRRHGKGDPIEGIGSCQHGLVCNGPTKLLTLLNAKKFERRLDVDRCCLRLQMSPRPRRRLPGGNMISCPG